MSGESALIDRARDWVVEKYPYNREHLVRSLEWLDRLRPACAKRCASPR